MSSNQTSIERRGTVALRISAVSRRVANGEIIDVPDLPDYVKGTSRPVAPVADETFSAPAGDGTYNTLEEHERALMLKAFEQAGNNQSQAARILRIGRDALRYKLKKYKIAM